MLLQRIKVVLIRSGSTASASTADVPHRRLPMAGYGGGATADLNTITALPGLLYPPTQASAVPSTESLAARAGWPSKTAIHVISLSGDGHEAGGNHHQCHGAHCGENGIGVSPNHLSGRELLVAVITHRLPSRSPRMPCDAGVATGIPHVGAKHYGLRSGRCGAPLLAHVERCATSRQAQASADGQEHQRLQQQQEQAQR